MRHSRSRGAGLVVAASLAATACGGSSPAAPRMLDTVKIERAIQQSALEQRGQRAKVTCPSKVNQRKGAGFSCTAVVGSTATSFTVTQVDGSGHVHYEAR